MMKTMPPVPDGEGDHAHKDHGQCTQNCLPLCQGPPHNKIIIINPSRRGAMIDPINNLSPVDGPKHRGLQITWDYSKREIPSPFTNDEGSDINTEQTGRRRTLNRAKRIKRRRFTHRFVRLIKPLTPFCCTWRVSLMITGSPATVRY